MRIAVSVLQVFMSLDFPRVACVPVSFASAARVRAHNCQVRASGQEALSNADEALGRFARSQDASDGEARREERTHELCKVVDSLFAKFS